MSLAYVAQVILQSLPRVRDEIQDTLGDRIWHNAVKVAHALPPVPTTDDYDAETEIADDDYDEESDDSDADA